MLLSPSICPSVSGADILRQFLVLVRSVSGRRLSPRESD